MEVEIGLYNDSECKKLMDKTGGNKLPRGIDSRIMICAGVSQGGKDACSVSIQLSYSEHKVMGND